MSDLSTSLPRVPRRFDINPKPLGAALVLIALGDVYLARTVGGRQAALYLVGALLGMSLYHAAFGFTSAWRGFIADGRGAGLRAQMPAFRFFEWVLENTNSTCGIEEGSDPVVKLTNPMIRIAHRQFRAETALNNRKKRKYDPSYADLLAIDPAFRAWQHLAAEWHSKEGKGRTAWRALTRFFADYIVRIQFDKRPEDFFLNALARPPSLRPWARRSSVEERRSMTAGTISSNGSCGNTYQKQPTTDIVCGEAIFRIRYSAFAKRSSSNRWTRRSAT